MANPITGNLAAPNDCISVSVTKWFHDEWHVRYTGTPRQFVAAGIADSDMERKILSRKGGARRGGRYRLPFRLRPTQLTRERVGYRPDYVLWKSDEAVILEWECGPFFLTKLPGVGELFPDGVPANEQQDDSELTHEQLTERFPTMTVAMAYVATAVASRIGASNVSNALLRSRCVGRRQRPAQWLSIGKVIAPHFVARDAA